MRIVLGSVLVAASLLPGAVRAGGEIHGTVTTRDGERLQGSIRWDRNENFWDDVLDAHKVLDDPEDDARISIFGWEIRAPWRSSRRHVPLAIAFGHLASIERGWPRGARLTLKDGTRIEVQESADLGRGMRDLVVRVDGRGDVELEWEDLERIDFAAGPGAGRDAERLYGDVVTSAGTFRGWIVWDRDESLREDVLDGDDERGRRQRIRFAEIRGIERLGRDRCRVVLADGATQVLGGTNDVDSGNRGIDVTVPGLGRVQVGWRELERVTFLDPPPSRTYDSFDGGRALHGTVTGWDGAAVRGTIRWDRDERYDWELLDGERQGIEYGIPLENVRAVRPRGSDEAELELRDGSRLVLGGSNDLDHRNRGITVLTAEGVEHEFDWDDVRSVEFEGR